jgi:hypothetical protein
VGASVLPEQSGLDELSPSDGPLTPGLQPNDRLVRLAPARAAFEPVVERGLGKAKQPGCFASTNISRSSTVVVVVITVSLAFGDKITKDRHRRIAGEYWHVTTENSVTRTVARKLSTAI